MTSLTESPSIKAAWVSPKTYRMLLAFRLIKDDHHLPFLNDGRIVLVNEMMPSTGIYDAPTPALAKRLALAAYQMMESQEKAA